MEYISEGAQLITGYPAADFLPDTERPPRRDFGALILPEETAEVRAIVDAALAEQRPFQLTYSIRHADGAERIVWDRGAGAYDDSGALVAVEGFITDITEPRRAEAERQELDFVLSMMKYRGFGGQTGYWDACLETFTLMAGLAAATSRIGLFPSVTLLAHHPAVCARMVATKIPSLPAGGA